jgi:uncharacterized membrane protein YcaP (DUF421 family)
MIQDMFLLHLPLLEKILRPLIVYVALIVLLRVFGKRELAQMNPFDLVVLLMLSNTVQNAIIGDDNSISGGLVGALALLTANYCVVRFVFKHRRLDQLLAGDPTLLMEHGKILHRNLARELMTESDLRTATLKQGFKSLDDIDICILEPGGFFCITPKEGHDGKPDTAQLMHKLEELQKEVRALKKA